MAASSSFTTLLGEALRAVRYARGLSQRGLAAELGVGKSSVNRLENGELSGSLLTLQQVLGRVGFEMTIVDRRSSAEREADNPPCARDPEAATIVACWQQRVDDEEVLDAAGRRPPAHRHAYPIRVPHRWWTARHFGTPWELRPIWSFTAYLTWPHFVRRLGRYPPPVGLPPRGGAPLQGNPPDPYPVSPGLGR